MSENELIATRVLHISANPAREVRIAIYRPAPDGNDYRCNFEISGLRAEKAYASKGMGVDSAQALCLALQAIGAYLYTCKEGKLGLLTWMGRRNLGFPVSDIIADLVPDD